MAKQPAASTSSPTTASGPALGDVVSHTVKEGDITVTRIGKLREAPKSAKPGSALLEVSIQVNAGELGKVIERTRDGAEAPFPVLLGECTVLA